MKADIVIKNGHIIDGKESSRYLGQVIIKGGEISDIVSNEKKVDAIEVIDAEGQVVCPGFIDTHVHSDLMLLWDRQHANGLYQGITTEVLGQDGLSYAPLNKENLDMYSKYLAGLNGRPDISYDWSSVNEYRMKFDNTVAINTAYQVPHGALRLETVGMKDVPLIGKKLKNAKDLLAKGLEDGAVAFSTGLSYFPCSYADTQELIELCKVAADYNSVYVTHIRSVFKNERFDPVKEAIEIAEKSGVKLHFSHFRTNASNAGKVSELMQDIDSAYDRGVDITLELYPYPAGSGYAVVLLPPWAVEDGFESTMERLADKRQRDKLIQGILENEKYQEGYFTHLRKNKSYIGKSYSEVAKERQQSIPDMICDILLEENLEVGTLGSPPYEDPVVWDNINRDYLELLSRPYYMIGSDAIPVGERPHPRAFGTFPRLLRFCREYNFSLEKMVNRMTNVAAQRFGLTDRGTIERKKKADIVIFNPKTVTDTATYKQPRSAPKGISHVIVNGNIAVREEKVTGIFAGRSLKRNNASN